MGASIEPPLTNAVFFILFALADGEKHGYHIMQAANSLSEGTVRIGPGTLYTAIARLLGSGHIGEVVHEEEERRRYYRLTRIGKQVLKSELDRQEAVLRKARQLRLLPAVER